MDSIDKLYFVFNAYDFDSVGSLSYDEVTLLLRSVIKGLAKMSPSSETFNAPGVRDAEKYATLLFEHFQKDPSSSHHHRVAAEEFRQYYSKHPVSSSWLSTTARMNDAQPPVDEQDFALDVPLNEPRRIVARNPLQDAAILSEDDHARLIELQEEAEQLLYAKRELAAKKKQQQQQDSESQDEAPAEEDEEAAALRAAAAKAAREAIDPRAPAWVKSVELMRPEELPEGVRSDPPEDVFEPLWVTGIITERDVTLEPTCSHSSTSTTSIPMPALVHRCVRYGNMNPNIPAVPDPDAPSGDEDSNSPPPVPAATLLAAAGSHLLYMRKDEELGWIQKALTSHSHRITCMDVHYGKNIIITAENSGESHRSTGGSIVIWHLDSLSVRRVITTPQYGVKLVNISENGTYFIAVSTDLQSTLSMYEVETGTVVFTRPLLLGPRVVKDAVIDVMFTKSTSLFAVSSATAGLTFFIEEGGSFMGPTGLKVYEERVGLYPSNSTSIGKATAEGGGGGGGVSPPIIITELCRFEKTDELVAGTLNGQILLWRGRTCAQLLQPTTGAVAAAGAINALDFNVASMTLISGNVNGVINMYSLVAAATVVPKSSSSSRGPQIIAPRLLELTATFDILRHQLCSYSIRSLSLSVDSRRALVSTAASEVLEIALYLRPPTAEELAEEEAAIAAAAEAAEALAAARAEALAAIAAAAEADGDEAAAAVTVPAEEEVVVPIPAIKKLLGDDLHNGPILSSHFKAPTTQEEEKEEEGVLLVTCLCRVPLGGFASCGSDGTVRWWQAVGGNEEVGTTGYRTSKVVKMDSGCSAVDACANAIAVALTGSDPNPSRTGSVHLFSLPETTFIIELRDHSLSSLQAISALKFSPEGNLLAAASQDGAVYVYQSVEGQWSLKGKCGITTAVSSSSSSSGGQSSFVSQLDFSSDGLYIRCFYGATDEFKIFDVSSAAGGPTFGKDLTDLTPPPAVVVVAPSPEESGAGGDGEDPAATTGEGEGGGPIGPPLELLRGLTWASHNCAVNWDTKGALSFQLTKTHSRGGGGGTGRGPACTDRFNHLLVTALGTGDVSVERVPSIQFTPLEEEDVDAAVSSRPVSFRAHLSQVSALTFIDEGARLVTAGSHDGMLRVWKVNYDMDEFEPDPHPATASSFEAAEEESTDEPAEEEEEEAGEGKPKKLPVIYDSGEDDDVIDLIRLKEHLSRDNNSKRRTLYEQQQRKQRRAKEVAALRAAAREELAATARELGQDPITTTATEQEAADDAAEEEEEKEYVPSTDISEHSGVKLWGECIGLKVETMTQSCGQALASSSQHTLVPSDELELSWVYGCSVRAAKASVHYSREGMIVYPAGCLAVIYNKKQHSQLYAMPHCDEITCMDVHVASGLAVSAHKGAGLISVCLWRTVDGAVLNSFPCGAVNGVSAVKLSPDAKLIAAVCQDHQHTVLLFDVKEGKLLTSYHSGPKKSLCIAFSQAASSSTGTLRFIVGGLLGFKLVTYIPARTALTGEASPAVTHSLPPLICMYFTLTNECWDNQSINHSINHLIDRQERSVWSQRGGEEVQRALRGISADAGRRGRGGVRKRVHPRYRPTITYLSAVALSSIQHNLGGNDKLISLLCCYCHYYNPTGMSDGSLGLVGRGESKVSAFSPALKGPVTALYVVKTKDGTADEPPAFKIVVGGTHGQLKVLDGELQPIAEWNLYQHRVKEDDASSFGGLLDLGRVRGFKSLCVDKMNRKILFGTAGGEIGELDFAKGTDINSSSSSGGSGGVGPLVSAHFRDQLHAMCVHPLRQECATAGDDKTLRIWQLEQKRMFTSIDLPDIARTVTFSPNGHLICAGLGGVVAGGSVRNPREMTGKVLVISYLQGLLRIVHTTADAEADITCVIFTPDGSKLLASSKDGRVYIYDALNNFVLIGKLEGVHKEGVRLLDISADGLVVTSTGTHDEFFVWNLSTLSVIGASSPTERYEVLSQIGYKWCVRQSPFGLNSIGIFPPFSDPADALTLSQSSDKKLLVAGDSFGALKLFSNPCTDLFAPYKRYFAHSPGGISKVSFTVDDQYLLSIGRSDKVLAQWRVLKSNIKPDAPTVSSVSAHTAAIDGGYGTSVGASSSSSVPQGDEDFLSSFTVKGVNFLTDRRQVKPFDSSQHPELKARIQSVVGTGNSAEQSSSSPSSPPSSLPLALFFGKGDLLTSIGKYPVLLDGSGKGMQKLFSLSSSSSSSPPQQVSTLAVSSDGKYALIGHSEGGRLVIVGTPSGELVIELSSSSSSSSGYPRPRPGGITAVAFSEDSSYCACLRGDAQHSLMLFRSFTGQWTDGVLVYSAASVTAGSMYLLSFIPTPAAAVGVAVDDDADESTTSRRPFTLVTAGAAPIRFWTLAGLNMHSIHGDYGEEYADSNNSNSNKPIFSSIAAIVRPSSKYRGQILTGDTLGTLFFWRHGKVMMIDNMDG